MVEVKIGECAVVTSFVGEEGEDTTNADVNAKIVPNGKRGMSVIIHIAIGDAPKVVANSARSTT
jgi:hypothetical protein